ncbi:MAG: orotate phosphoribosyltransferase [Bacteroidia bacterium]|nr:orotate phosphoribosyltransferase [Bacteroidia bacterium]
MSLESYACFLWQEQIVQVRTSPPWFVWASGKESPLYVDHRRLLSYPSWREWVTEEMARMIQSRAISCKAIVGVATGGIAWAAWIGSLLRLPIGYVRPQVKSHGLGKQIEGLPSPPGSVLLVEDLLSTGGSLRQAADALLREGYPIAAIAVLWSYDAPGQAPFPYPLHALLTFPRALLYWREAGYLSPEAFSFLSSWHQQGLQLPLETPLR